MSKVGILYLVGDGRSGTTLLSRLLDLEADHRAIGEVSSLGVEDNWTLPCGCGVAHAECPVWGPLIATWSDSSRLAAWKEVLLAGVGRRKLRDGSKHVRDGVATGLDELRRVYESLGQPGTVLVDESKRPWLGRLLARQSWTDVRFVQLVRDPDDVVASWSKVKEYHRQIPAETVAKAWLRRQAVSEMLRRTSGRPWLRLPYEELANSPQQALEKVLQRPAVGLHWDGSSWIFPSRENHIYLSNSDKLRRGLETVRPISPRMDTHEEPGQSGWERLARSIYRSESKRLSTHYS